MYVCKLACMHVRTHVHIYLCVCIADPHELLARRIDGVAAEAAALKLVNFNCAKEEKVMHVPG